MSAAELPLPHHWINVDGTCHAGDLFEAGTPAERVYLGSDVARLLAEAWDEGYGDDLTCNEPRENPYRTEAQS